MNYERMKRKGEKMNQVTSFFCPSAGPDFTFLYFTDILLVLFLFSSQAVRGATQRARY